MNAKIISCFDAIYSSSYDRTNGKPHAKDNWRDNYRQMKGRLWIIRRDSRQYFQWQPFYGETSEIIINQGMVSSNDDYYIENSKIIITTENSIYHFLIVKNHEEIVLPQITW